MNKKWIGHETETSGSYYSTKFEELQIKSCGWSKGSKLYRFKSRFGQGYNITDEKAVETIESLLSKEETKELCEYLYQLVIDNFGMVDFLINVGHKIAKERDEGYRKGKQQKQREIKAVLGLR
ncbi:hypothetical protein WKH56_20485 [Priestia sp. SB1]|uniref:hypothetical protein n=1 Tax=Priestia sp. SB1 TaxID=3132359 RepID=UPI003181D4FD